MSELTKIIGQRVRNYRTEKGLSQEKLAELSGCHPTYIGQVERGEKNATLDSIEKIASAMGVSLSKLFEKIGEGSADSYPMRCYELVAAKSKSEQEHLYKMLVEMVKYKNHANCKCKLDTYTVEVSESERRSGWKPAASPLRGVFDTKSCGLHAWRSLPQPSAA